MVFQSMADVQAEGIAFCDAHPDLEVFRLRLGKALNFEFFEDSQTGLFQRRDPREGWQQLYPYTRLFTYNIRIKGDRVSTSREVTNIIVLQLRLTDEIIP